MPSDEIAEIEENVNGPIKAYIIKSTEKGLKLKNDDGLMAWIPKSAIQQYDKDLGIVTPKDWFKGKKIIWKREK